MLKNALLALALCSIAVSAPCFAHAKLQSSSPADHARLTAAPKTLTLNFSETAKLALLKLQQNGKDIPIALDANAKAAKSFNVTLPALAPGNYTVQWTALASDDGHVTKGTFAFVIARSP